jgi:hypothetical protein
MRSRGYGLGSYGVVRCIEQGWIAAGGCLVVEALYGYNIYGWACLEEALLFGSGYVWNSWRGLGEDWGGG